MTTKLIGLAWAPERETITVDVGPIFFEGPTEGFLIARGEVDVHYVRLQPWPQHRDPGPMLYIPAEAYDDD